jgi:hypothetical protein
MLDEQTVAMQRVVSGGDAAAGHRGNEIHFLQQRAVVAVDPHRLMPQRVQQMVGRRRRTHATTGKREAQQQCVGIVAARQVGDAILRSGVGRGRGRRIARRLQRGTACQRQRQRQKRRRAGHREGRGGAVHRRVRDASHSSRLR